ncbi:hypothetical protein CB1_000644024 [Camelus ferus]|nr:hypothetical protein CB1_000644024 [Camelus ferus]
MEASVILPILKKKLAFLSGGKDRRSGLILTIPLCLEQTNMDELSVTLDYLLSIPSEKCKARGFTVIVDGRKSQWNVVKTVVLMLQPITAYSLCHHCLVVKLHHKAGRATWTLTVYRGVSCCGVATLEFWAASDVLPEYVPTVAAATLGPSCLCISQLSFLPVMAPLDPVPPPGLVTQSVA